MELVNLSFGDVLYEPDDVITHVHFPNDSIISLLSAVAERSTLEVGMVGNEGMAGISVFMGVDVSRNQFLVQGSGTAVRMKRRHWETNPTTSVRCTGCCTVIRTP